MNDQSLGHGPRSPKRSFSTIIGCIVAGIGIGIASTQVVFGQDLVPAPPVDADSDDPVPGVEALPRKRDDNLLRTNVPPPPPSLNTNVPPPPPSLNADIPRFFGSGLENPFAKSLISEGQEKAVPAVPIDKSAAENSFDDLYWKGYSCHVENKLDKALEYYNRAIKCNPEIVEVRANRAQVLIGLKQFSNALNDLDIVIQQKSGPWEVYSLRGYVRCELVKPGSDDTAFKPALADVSCALKLNPNDARSRFVRGMIAARQGDYERAIADLSWAIEHEHDLWEARYYRGRSFEMKGETDRAITDLTKALNSCPKNPTIYACRAQLYVEKNAFDRALADFDQVVRLRPDDVQGYLQRTAILLLKGDNGRALADIEKVVHLKPESAAAHFMHAITLCLVDPKSDRALAEMDKAIGLDPQAILYPAFRCFLNGKKNKYGPVFKDLALCAAILAQSRLRYHVSGDQKQNRFQVVAGLVTHDRCKLGFIGRIDFEQEKFLLGIGFTDGSKDSDQKHQVSEMDQQLINQNVRNLLAATFVGGSQ